MEFVKEKQSINKYPAYKQSGVEWLEDVPSHWELKKIKRIFVEKKYSTNVDLNCGSISFGKVVLKDDEKIPLSTKKSYQILSKGEFLVNPLNLNYDLISLRIALSELDVVISSGYIILKNRIEINKTFFKWLLHRFDVAYMKLLGSGVRQTLNYKDIGECDLVFPPLNEQKSIANFLENKTALIDQAINIKEKQIELLKERRQILIHKAVTRGLNLNVKMKDSGVEWIGEVPEHWEIKALKYIAKLQSGETISPNSFIDNDEGFPVYGGNGFRGYTNTFTNDGEYVLIGRQGALCGNVNFANGKFYASEHAIVVYPIKEVKTYWLGEAIRLANFNRLSQSAAQPGIAVNVIKNILFPHPTIQEQRVIEEYVQKLSKIVERAVNLKEKEIFRLLEYKSTLINSVVTGKIKVF